MGAIDLPLATVRLSIDEVAMVTLIEQYRRWFAYEKDSHRKVLASFDTVPEGGRGLEPFQKAMNIMGHIIAGRRIWLNRLDRSKDEPAKVFPTGVTRDDLLTELEVMERDWSGYFQRLDESEIDGVLVYERNESEWFRCVIADVLIHLYGHSLYHRGQIASLVRAAGGQPAETDFIYWSRESISSPPS
jgi:uncharacterized damage-inducible protein DinB